jgi:uncharacterized protein YxjI
METEELLREQARGIRQKLNVIERERRAKRLSAVVGKAFKYWNGYDHERRWWLYTKPLRVSEDGHLFCFSFETTSEDEIKIEPSKKVYFGMTDGYQEIEQAEFDLAWKAVQDRIAAIQS